MAAAQAGMSMQSFILERALAGTEPAPTQFEHNDLMRMRDLRREPRTALTNREFCSRRYSPDMAVALCQRDKGHIGRCGPGSRDPRTATTSRPIFDSAFL